MFRFQNLLFFVAIIPVRTFTDYYKTVTYVYVQSVRLVILLIIVASYLRKKSKIWISFEYKLCCALIWKRKNFERMIPKKVTKRFFWLVNIKWSGQSSMKLTFGALLFNLENSRLAMCFPPKHIKCIQFPPHCNENVLLTTFKFCRAHISSSHFAIICIEFH